MFEQILRHRDPGACVFLSDEEPKSQTKWTNLGKGARDRLPPSGFDQEAHLGMKNKTKARRMNRRRMNRSVRATSAGTQLTAEGSATTPCLSAVRFAFSVTECTVQKKSYQMNMDGMDPVGESEKSPSYFYYYGSRVYHARQKQGHRKFWGKGQQAFRVDKGPLYAYFCRFEPKRMSGPHVPVRMLFRGSLQVEPN